MYTYVTQYLVKLLYIIYEVWKELKEKWTRISDQ